MSTLNTAALWSATALAFDDKKLGSAGLSIRQRKLLAMLSTPASVAQLAPRIAMPEIEVQAALERFAKLGLAKSDAAVPFNPMQARSQVLARSATAGVESSSRMPVMIGVAVAVLALMAASAWLLRGSPPAASTSVPNSKNDAPIARASTAATPIENTDTAAPSAINTTAVAAAPPARSGGATSAATPTATSAPVIATAGPPTAATLSGATKAARTVAPILVPGKSIELAAPAVTTTTPSAPGLAAPAASAGPAPAPAAVAAAPSPAPAAAPIAIAAVAPTAPPPTTVATAPPVATPIPLAASPRPAPAREIKLVNRVEPGFPRGVDAERGSVRARLQVDSRGVVTNVEIVESIPPRVFDRTVRNALAQWRYEPTGEAFSTAAEISFAR